MNKYNYVILIGRFQPFHLAHQALLSGALKRGREVVVVVGSANTARSVKNPWTASQRAYMIEQSLPEDQRDKVHFVYLSDYLYNDNIWVTDLQQKIYSIIGDDDSVAIIGHEHDRSSYYLRLFPQWDCIAMKNMDQHPHATEIRLKYFREDDSWEKNVPKGVVTFLKDYQKTENYSLLQKELQFLLDYANSWKDSPFPPTFVTVDCVVIKSGHVLVVRRRGHPGKGQIALPGGFLKTSEFIKTGAIRELKEETAIKISKAELESAIIEQRVFDHPDRSLRGRTITHAFLMDLKSGPLPRVKGSYDADKAWWMPLHEVYAKENGFFEDHWHIIMYYCHRF